MKAKNLEVKNTKSGKNKSGCRVRIRYPGKTPALEVMEVYTEESSAIRAARNLKKRFGIDKDTPIRVLAPNGLLKTIKF